ncbi:MAG TPA: transcription elongation factor GreB [Gammaproteobacteria bacterium]|nr:transcription elongation factor GreB [Gammaproteobacteria bacterium]HCK94347.1 transcription elongation factor GreB [Gammaproteobacteria bacterium]|tara:strand:+ start:546 stop:1016 length:471 start_codon:yes stop_codon:yes gene_type:complete
MSKHITVAGYEAMQDEFYQLRYKRRPEVTKALSAAAAEGDRSENAEYIYRKKELREIDRRIRYLQKRLPDLIVVRQKPTDLEAVFFGARVTVEDDDGVDFHYHIVGSDEIGPGGEKISINSPVARALLKKRVGDEVSVSTPKGPRYLFIKAVEYNI